MKKREAFIGERALTAPVREDRNRVYGILANAPIAPFLVLGIFFMMSVQIWGSASVAAMCALWIFLLAYLMLFEPRKFLSIFKWSPFLLLPALAIASIAWSVAPDVSMRFGVQLMMTALIGITVAVAVTARQFVTLVYLTMVMLTIGAFLSQNVGYGTEGAVLIGLVGSKNEAAYAWQLLATAAIAVLLDRGQPVLLRLSALPSIGVAAILLALGQASGALVSMGIAIVVLGGVAMLHLFKLPGRLVIVLAMAIVVTPMAAAHDIIEKKIEMFMQEVLKKDTTLTGRTYLWARADELIKERPVLGRGYRATLIGNTIEGQGILRWAGQSDGRAFHFHNTYRDVAVDLGFSGVILFIAYLAFSLLSLIRVVIGHPTPAYGFFLAMLLVIIAKSFGELVLSQFTMMSAILFSLFVWSFAKPKQNAQWQVRVVAPEGAYKVRENQARVAAQPTRLAAPIRSR